MVCKPPLSLARTRLIVPENIDSEGPKQPPNEAWTCLEMKVECKRKALIRQDQKVLTASQHTLVFSHVALWCQVASCVHLQIMEVKVENFLSWGHTVVYTLKYEKFRKPADCLLHF